MVYSTYATNASAHIGGIFYNLGLRVIQNDV